MTCAHIIGTAIVLMCWLSKCLLELRACDVPRERGEKRHGRTSGRSHSNSSLSLMSALTSTPRRASGSHQVSPTSVVMERSSPTFMPTMPSTTPAARQPISYTKKRQTLRSHVQLSRPAPQCTESMRHLFAYLICAFSTVHRPQYPCQILAACRCSRSVQVQPAGLVGSFLLYTCSAECKCCQQSRHYLGANKCVPVDE